MASLWGLISYRPDGSCAILIVFIVNVDGQDGADSEIRSRQFPFRFLKRSNARWPAVSGS